MRAILVSVGYSDLLGVTLPWNRHHFETVTVVTSRADAKTVYPIAARSNAHVLVTDLFYENGAVFNKWAALEWGLDCIGRTGWLCVMDADVLWPKDLRWEEGECSCHGLPDMKLRTDSGRFQSGLHFGHLYTPRRRMLDPVPTGLDVENSMRNLAVFPLHRQEREFAGYSQIFHAHDPALGLPPWHQTDWKHAGGADSFFQMKWPGDKKVRPPFEVLHLGPAGTNWCGRASQYLDGTSPPEAAERHNAMNSIWRGRVGKTGMERFTHERLPTPPTLPPTPSSPLSPES